MERLRLLGDQNRYPKTSLHTPGAWAEDTQELSCWVIRCLHIGPPQVGVGLPHSIRLQRSSLFIQLPQAPNLSIPVSSKTVGVIWGLSLRKSLAQLPTILSWLHPFLDSQDSKGKRSDNSSIEKKSIRFPITS